MTAGITRPAQILLVEDDPGDVLITSEALADSPVDYEVWVVGDGAEALDFLHRRGVDQDAPRPDLVLLDLNLPKVHGGEVLNAVRASSDLAEIRVVILTTSTADRDLSSASAGRAAAYLTKPVEFERFREVVRTIDRFFRDPDGDDARMHP